MTTVARRAFDVGGPLPSGLTVLEASAGTGKTFAIAGLATRYLAEGERVDQLLLVTFTRNATGELRERVRERLGAVHRGLVGALEGAGPGSGDPVVQLLAAGPPDVLDRRRNALGRALAAFDAITITTTDGFCQHVLRDLGVLGDVDRDVTFVEDVEDLIEEVVDDFYLRKFHRVGGPPGITRRAALAIARLVVHNADATIEPDAAAANPTVALGVRLAHAVRREVDRRKRRAGVLTYDDFLARLRATLADPVHGTAAGDQLRARYRVVLIDEFQDTDPVQWEIVRRAFGTGATRLVLVGDPKQAIFAFRGADVYAYLQAARLAGAPATLETNWRSDQALLDAYDALFGDACLGHPNIVYRRVVAATPEQVDRLRGAPVRYPLRFRVAHRADGWFSCTKAGYGTVDSVRPYIARDLAQDVARLLTARPTLEAARPGHRPRPLLPADVAVLVRTRKQAEGVVAALREAGVPAVFSGVGSVCATAPAVHWLRLLEALERPTDDARARAAALTPFLGWAAAQVATADDAAWEEVHIRLHRWAGVLRRRGVAALFETIGRSEGLAARVLRIAGGERALADLRHLAELLHAAASAEQLGVSGLAAWLRQRAAEAEQDVESQERSRRLETDDDAVQVLTIHRSKGLEFPVVYCPYLWDPAHLDATGPPIFHDPDAEDRRAIDLGGSDAASHRQRSIAEQRGEELRLTYVALTRARHQAVVWWAGSRGSRDAPLTRLLLRRGLDGTSRAQSTSVPTDAALVQRLEELAAAAPGRISVERSGELPRSAEARVAGKAPRFGERRSPAGSPGPGSPGGGAHLELARFGRALDDRWRRTSYSDLTAPAHDPVVSSEPEETAVADERAAGGVPPEPAGDPAGGSGRPADPAENALRAIGLPLAAMPGGMAVGSLVHRVLELTDFAAADIDAELTARLREAGGRQFVQVGEPAVVVAGLRAALETPLGPLAADRRLRDVPRADRRDELGFELPLAGGDAPTGALDLAGVGALLHAHLDPADPLARYPERLADPVLAGEVRGYLSGSLDLVLRSWPADGPRFLVVDYKTNRLDPGPPAGEPPAAWHYRPAALVAEMQRMHYPLQALLYTVALHRYLRWRLPRYDPERNLGGALYLFLRGMCGAATPRVGRQPCGVFDWRPPPGLVVALSDLLDRGSVR